MKPGNNHRILFEIRANLKCITCGQMWEPKDFEEAEKHLRNPDSLEIAGTYNCDFEGCNKTFETEQGLGVHKARMKHG